MKVNDLLNLVYEKKAPKNILYNHREYKFNKETNDYENKDGLELLSYLFRCERQALWKDVEIIEEIKKPEKIEKWDFEVDKFTDCYYDTALLALANQNEELRIAVNYLLKKEDDSNK